MTCEHAPHDDPRFPTTCVKCGKVVYGQRQRPIEDLLHCQAELPQGLLELTHDRTESRPHADLLEIKDWSAEADEELADAVNYITWLMLDPLERKRGHRALKLLGAVYRELHPEL